MSPLIANIRVWKLITSRWSETCVELEWTSLLYVWLVVLIDVKQEMYICMRVKGIMTSRGCVKLCKLYDVIYYYLYNWCFNIPSWYYIEILISTFLLVCYDNFVGYTCAHDSHLYNCLNCSPFISKIINDWVDWFVNL